MSRVFTKLDGMILSLMRLVGNDVSPVRPGERPSSLFGGKSSDLMSYLYESGALDKKANSLYPALARNELLDLLDDMDRSGIASSVVNGFTDDALAHNPDKMESIEIEAPGPIRKELHTLLATLHAEDNKRNWCREMCKTGDGIRRLIYATDEGVTHVVPVPLRDMEIVRDINTHDVEGYKQKDHTFRGTSHQTSWPWDFINFKLPGLSELDKYGCGVLTPGIRSWTMMSLMEDSALQYKLKRQPDRTLYTIDVGSATYEEAEERLQSFRRSLLRKVVNDPVTATLKQEYNPWNMMEDIVMGTRGDSATEVKTLNGSNAEQQMNDVLYFLKKFLNDCDVPPMLYGIEDPSGNSEPIRRNRRMSNQDIRYARRVRMIQKSFTAALFRLCEIHLTLRRNVTGIKEWHDPNTGKPLIKIKLPPPSFLEEMDRMEVETLRLELAEKLMLMGETNAHMKAYEWTVFVLTDVLRYDSKFVARVTQEKPRLLPGEEPPPVAEKPPTKKPVKKQSDSKRSVPINGSLNGSMNGFHRVNGSLNRGEVGQLCDVIEANPVLQERIARIRELTDGTPDAQ